MESITGSSLTPGKYGLLYGLNVLLALNHCPFIFDNPLGTSLIQLEHLFLIEIFWPVPCTIEDLDPVYASMSTHQTILGCSILVIVFAYLHTIG